MSRRRNPEAEKNRDVVVGGLVPKPTENNYFTDIAARKRAIKAHQARKPEVHDVAGERFNGLGQHAQARTSVDTGPVEARGFK